jgi:hypothetical protein
MADKKISALTGATTPLAGTEVLPIVQSGATVKVAVSDLTAGRAISATQLTSTVAIGTAPLVVTSTTNVANLNASSLNGATFAAPGAIGGTTASTGTFTTATAAGGHTSKATTVTTSFITIATSAAPTSAGVAVVSGYQTSSGNQGVWLVSFCQGATTVISSTDNTATVPSFQFTGSTLQMKTTINTLAITCCLLF